MHSEIVFVDGESDPGGISFVPGPLRGPAWDSAVAMPAPSDPPHFRCQTLPDLHRPCLPRVYSRPNETPQSPRPKAGPERSGICDSILMRTVRISEGT